MNAITSGGRESASALSTYYFLRAGVSIAWVVLAFSVGRDSAAIASVLIVLYPAWDALANVLDARSNGGLRHNPSQATNALVSGLATVAIALALSAGFNTVVAVFGVWAALAGLLQLVTGVRRWNAYGAQWAMILSGAQSILAGVFFVIQSQGEAALTIGAPAGYAGFGAFYFLVSALWLRLRPSRQGA